MEDAPQLPLLPRHKRRPSSEPVCGMLNIIVGIAAGLGGLLITGLIRAIGGFVSDGILPLALLLAGVLSISGVCLRFSSERARSVSVGLLALAVVLSLVLVGFGMEGDDSILFTLPFGLVALLVIVELVYLWWPKR